MDTVLPEDPVIPLLGIYPKDTPTDNKDTCSTMFITALFIIARSWKEPRCPSIEEWIQKVWYIYTMEYYSGIRNNDFMKFLGKWMELETMLQGNNNREIKNLLFYNEKKEQHCIYIAFRCPPLLDQYLLRYATLNARYRSNCSCPCLCHV